MNKKAEVAYKRLLEIFIAIIFFILAGLILYFLINKLTG